MGWNMRRSGELIQWNNKGGYGFVRDEQGREYYVHISKVPGDSRPRLGDRLTFDVATGRNGRPAAVDVIIAPQPTTPAPRPSLRPTSSNVSPYKLGLRTAAATMMTLLIVLAIANGHMTPWFSLIYIFMGTASALFYRFDKLYALNGQYRVSEGSLHIVDFTFGIIGGLAAQEVYRHKTVKPRFVATTWAIALLHTVALAFVAFVPFSA